MIILTDEPLDPVAVTDSVRADGNGAVVTFLGTTRDNFGGKEVTRLEYEAYDVMAIKKMHEVRDSLRADYGIEDIAIAHRTGRVDVGHISLVVAVASPHRVAAFEACHEAVNRIKTIVPIWKKEWFADGSRWVACEDHEFADEAEHEHAHAERHAVAGGVRGAGSSPSPNPLPRGERAFIGAVIRFPNPSREEGFLSQAVEEMDEHGA